MQFRVNNLIDPSYCGESCDGSTIAFHRQTTIYKQVLTIRDQDPTSKPQDQRGKNETGFHVTNPINPSYRGERGKRLLLQPTEQQHKCKYRRSEITPTINS